MRNVGQTRESLICPGKFRNRVKTPGKRRNTLIQNRLRRICGDQKMLQPGQLVTLVLPMICDEDLEALCNTRRPFREQCLKVGKTAFYHPLHQQLGEGRAAEAPRIRGVWNSGDGG